MKRQVQKNKISKILVGISTLQISLILILVLNRLFVYLNILPANNFNSSDTILISLIIIIAATFYFMIIEIKSYAHEQLKMTVQQEIIENIQKLNLQMRAQRHDFLNHIQIIYSLIEMDEYEEVKNYLNKVYGDLENVNQSIRTEDVAINALLQAKYNDAIRKQIKFNIHISTSLHGLSVPSWEMCRVLGNLIDNGLYATSQYACDKSLTIYIKENLRGFIFEVTNTSDTIEKENIDKLFEAGFTTKKDAGGGMGLFIVKNIVQSYNGFISVSSENNITMFRVSIPKALE